MAKVNIPRSGQHLGSLKLDGVNSLLNVTILKQ